MLKRRKQVQVARHVYEECFGFVPPKKLIRHKCDNPLCINPEHLEIGGRRENFLDYLERGKSRARL